MLALQQIAQAVESGQFLLGRADRLPLLGDLVVKPLGSQANQDRTPGHPVALAEVHLDDLSAGAGAEHLTAAGDEHLAGRRDRADPPLSTDDEVRMRYGRPGERHPEQGDERGQCPVHDRGGPHLEGQAILGTIVQVKNECLRHDRAPRFPKPPRRAAVRAHPPRRSETVPGPGTDHPAP